MAFFRGLRPTIVQVVATATSDHVVCQDHGVIGTVPAEAASKAQVLAQRHYDEQHTNSANGTVSR